MKTLLFSAVTAMTMSLYSGASGADVRFFSIGSGDISGNYYPVARSICDAFNASDDTRRRCSPEPTAGSVYNLTALRAGEIEFAIVQSDWLRAAYNATEVFEDALPMKNLQVVMPLFPETITVLVGPGKEINTAIDLAGKIVDIGRPASGRNATIRSLLQKLEVGDGFFGTVKELDPSASVAQLCEGTIDAAVFVVGHPSELIQKALGSCNTKIADFAGPRIDTFIAASEDYQRTRINLGAYSNQTGSVPSISVMSTLVTTRDFEEAIVRDLVNVITANLAELAREQPVLRALEQTLANTEGLGVPVHPMAQGSP